MNTGELSPQQIEDVAVRRLLADGLSVTETAERIANPADAGTSPEQ